MAQLPPPDPNESPPTVPGLDMETPAAAFLMRPPSEQEERLAVAILTARPGALVVVARD